MDKEEFHASPNNHRRSLDSQLSQLLLDENMPNPHQNRYSMHSDYTQYHQYYQLDSQHYQYNSSPFVYTENYYPVEYQNSYDHDHSRKSLDLDSSLLSKDRKRRTLWSQEEIQALHDGMVVHGSNWARITSDERFKHILKNRTQVQCKDKAAFEKEKRLLEGSRNGVLVTDEELGIWKLGSDRKRVLKKL